MLSWLSPQEWTAVLLSLKVATWATVASLPFGVLVALALARGDFWGKELLNGLVHLPLILPPVVTGYLLLLSFGRKGPIGALLDQVGIVFAFRWTGAALACGIMAFPLMVRAIRLAIEAVDPRLEEAAGTLGAGRAWTFLVVTLPLIAPGIVAGSILAFAKAMGEFGATITFVSNIPGETQTIPTAIYSLLAGAGRRGRRDPADADLDRHRHGRAPRLGVRGAAGRPPRRRPLSGMGLEVALRHDLGGFRLDVAFTAPAGITALFGRSGSGKTTVVNAIAGLLRPEMGRILVDGAVLLDTTAGVFVPRHRRRIGYVFQEGRLFPHLSVRQNLVFGRWFAADRAPPAEIGHVVEMLGIGHLLDRRPAGLSGGEKQRVAIGRALLASPRLLLMDEPLASLDAARKEEILPYLERLRDEVKVPILYVSHAIPEVTRLATTVVALVDGRVALSGPATAVLSDPAILPAAERDEAGVILTARLIGHDPDGLSAAPPRRRAPAGAAGRGAVRRVAQGADPRPRRDAGDPPARGDQRAQHPGSPLPRSPRRRRRGRGDPRGRQRPAAGAHHPPLAARTRPRARQRLLRIDQDGGGRPRRRRRLRGARRLSPRGSAG